MNQQQAEKLAKNPAVASVEPVRQFSINGTQSNPPSWGLDRIDQASAKLNKSYKYPNTGSKVTAYIVDSGINLKHQDFGGRASFGFDAFAPPPSPSPTPTPPPASPTPQPTVSPTSTASPTPTPPASPSPTPTVSPTPTIEPTPDPTVDPTEPSELSTEPTGVAPATATNPTAKVCDGHGTHVAGTVGGTKYGVAKGVKLVDVRVFRCDGYGDTESVVAGINWVTENAKKPAVVNMSLGADADPVVDAAVKRSIKSGLTYAISAGNESPSTPARCHRPECRTRSLSVPPTGSTSGRSSPTTASASTCSPLG